MSLLQISRSTEQDGKVDVSEPNALPAWEQDAALAIVGRRIPRVEGVAKVTGRAQYSADVRLPGQLSAKVLRGPHPHARITRIDTTRAEELPGIHAVLTHANAPAIGWYQDSFLFDPTLRFVGDEVAAVAAESEAIASDALALIEVDYEPLPFVVEMEKALAPDAPQLHADAPGNVAGEPKEQARGDTDAGFAVAEVVLDETYTTHVALHNCFETHGCVANWEGGHLTLWDSTQSIFTVREQVARKLGMPEHRVRVIKQFMGGGFGSKQIAWKHDVIASLLSKMSGRPVQLMLDREAENLAVGARNETRQRVRLGAKRDGTLTAIEVEIDQSTGAHLVGGEGSDTAGIYHTLYKCPNVRTVQRMLYTNTGPAIAFRAPGHFEGAFALESAIDELARKLELDPVELRRRNYTEVQQQEEKPYSTPESLRRCYDRATEVFGWDDVRPQREGRVRTGRGFAAHDWSGSGSPPGYAWVKLNADGTADIVTGTQDIGTGTRTGLAQVAAEELGVPLEAITIHLGDTASGPYSPVSSGSITQATIGPAIRAAAAEAKRRLLDVAATLLEASPDDLTIEGGRVYVAGSPAARSIPVADVTGAIGPVMLQGQGAREPNDQEHAIRTFGAQCAEVAVDIETGDVTVLRLAASHDCGRIVNPTMVESQVIGAVTQGLGFALTEGRVVDPRYGISLNPNLEDYKIPTVLDVPKVLHGHLDIADPFANSTGVKGIGEPPLVPTAPAIANAIFDATGVRLRHSQLTRQHLLAALAAQRAETTGDDA